MLLKALGTTPSWFFTSTLLNIIDKPSRLHQPSSRYGRALLVEAYRRRKPVGSVDDQYVFHRDGEPMDDRAILKDVIRPAAKRLGFYFEGFGWHSFRRQNITVLQEEGATAFEAMEQAGHSRPST